MSVPYPLFSFRPSPVLTRPSIVTWTRLGPGVYSKRIFLLGPSHHYHLDKIALSQHVKYGTPLGDISLDLAGEHSDRTPRFFDRVSCGTGGIHVWPDRTNRDRQ